MLKWANCDVTHFLYLPRAIIRTKAQFSPFVSLLVHSEPYEPKPVLYAALTVVRGQSAPMDLVRVETKSQVIFLYLLPSFNLASTNFDSNFIHSHLDFIFIFVNRMGSDIRHWHRKWTSALDWLPTIRHLVGSSVDQFAHIPRNVVLLAGHIAATKRHWRRQRTQICIERNASAAAQHELQHDTRQLSRLPWRWRLRNVRHGIRRCAFARNERHRNQPKQQQYNARSASPTSRQLVFGQFA